MPLVTHSQNPNAHGNYNPAEKKMTLLAGSILQIDPENQEIHANIAAGFEKFGAELAEGNIVINQDGDPQVAHDIPNLFVSTAHVLAMGTRGSAFDLWLMDDGTPIRALHAGGQNQNEDEDGPNPQQNIPGNLCEDDDHDDEDEDMEDPAADGDFGAVLPPHDLPPLPEEWAGVLPAGIAEDCLSLYRFPPLPDYLRINRHRILALGAQALPPWQPGYDAFRDPVMQRLRYAFPERRISREGLVALFESWHDPVLCLVAAMVWGGIRHRGAIPRNHLAALLAMGEPALRDRMEALRPLVRSGAFERAFTDCSKKSRLKFDGVRYPFFTKLFFFIGQVPPVLQPTPLILDRWTSSAFLVLGRQVCSSPKWQEWFDTSPLCSGKPAVWKVNPDELKYRLYVAWFNHWAQELGTSAAQLEQFVFGWSRKRKGDGKAWWNPRNQLIALGKSFFCPPAP